jgi:hypothetical protein
MTESNNALKDCPFCGEQINSKAIKCKHCQSMLTENNNIATKDCPFCGEKIKQSDTSCIHCQSALVSSPSVPPPPTVNKGAKLEVIISDHQKKHRLAHPLPQKDQPKQGGVMGFIKKSIADMKGPSEVAFIEEITSAVLANHNKYTVGLNPTTEKPLYVVNTTCGVTGTGAVLTTQHLYYSVKPAKSLMMGLGSNIMGRVPITEIQAISIGSSDTALGSAYSGHDFYLNGQKLGWLRMGTGACWDDEVLECTQELFGKLSAEVFSMRQ